MPVWKSRGSIGRQLERASTFPSPAVLVFLLQFRSVCLGRPCRANCTHQRGTGHQSQTDIYCEIPARLFGLSDPSRSRGGRALHVFRVFIRWQSRWLCRGTWVHIARLASDAPRVVSLFPGRFGEQVFQRVVQGRATNRRCHGKSASPAHRSLAAIS